MRGRGRKIPRLRVLALDQVHTAALAKAEIVTVGILVTDQLHDVLLRQRCEKHAELHLVIAIVATKQHLKLTIGHFLKVSALRKSLLRLLFQLFLLLNPAGF